MGEKVRGGAGVIRRRDLVERDEAPFNSYALKPVLSFLVTLFLRVTSSSSRGSSEERKKILVRHSTPISSFREEG